MNVWIESISCEGWEECVISYFKEKGIWDKVVYQKNNQNEFSTFLFEKEIYNSDRVRIVPPALYDKIYNCIFIFVDLYSRNSPLSQNTYPVRNLHDMIELFNLEVRYIYTQFLENNINLYIAPRAPHLGVDYLRYAVAKEMGIKTLILEQSLTPNRFFYYWDNADYGLFETSKPLFVKEKFKIKEEYKKEWFYTTPKKVPVKEKIKNWMLPDMSFRRIIKPSNFICLAYNYFLSKQFHKSRMLGDIDVDFNKKYVYFAMHLQPEKTTSNWGGMFNDQLLALERLSLMIPDDWCIYVKDNPKQGHFMRGKWFYKRLSLIPKVKVVSSQTNTFELTASSVFVATISGTVGWEAISGGKCVLYFGWGTWYKTLPGAFEYREGLDVNEIISYHIKHEDVENKMSELGMKMGHGVIYKEYYEMVENFSDESNVKDIIDSLEKIINNI